MAPEGSAMTTSIIDFLHASFVVWQPFHPYIWVIACMEYGRIGLVLHELPTPTGKTECFMYSLFTDNVSKANCTRDIIFIVHR